ncbi:MAG: hypothetical protein K8F35_14715 [Dokdonella sp.]|uniref:tetratricopeptide repeat protein n=1 Tax=Dokdonella sp. TaxID=2291710 RepID=UPI0027B8B69A|nr:tetratricopeptide repeat protein [Dokdonella sp.]MBZ0224265.1 hypothetical protein [Dokdonella sp.]
MLVGLLLLAGFAYWNGLRGGFVYDDASSILANPNVHIRDLDLATWWRAAVEFPSGVAPFRSLTMLSFAANHYFSGLAPHAYKLTNLAIHLVNGMLLFLLLRALLALSRACSSLPRDQHAKDAAAVTVAVMAGLWVLLPINISAVLYVVQRLEALATSFVFLGLWWYCSARRRLWQTGRGQMSLCASVIVCSSFGALAKESAVMLPLYAAVIELCLPNTRNADGHRSRTVIGLFACTLVLPLIAGLIWLWRLFIDWDTLFSGHASTVSRLLTESRVLIDYIAWTLVPRLDSLTLYHDDIERSSGLLAPPTTVLAILALATLAAVGIWQRKQRPLFALGIAWFFAGHVLTATIIPLVLAFEHRNYFPSVGLLLACTSLVGLERPLVHARVRRILTILAIAFYASTTWMRAQEWADPMQLARSDALKRPQSSAAQFDFAQALLAQSARTDNQADAQAALTILDKGRTIQGAGIQFEQAIIVLLGQSGYPAPEAVWDTLMAKLARGPLDNNSVHALSQLNHCFADAQCQSSQRDKLAQAYALAAPHDNGRTDFISVRAEYAWHVLGNHALAEHYFREGLAQSPSNVRLLRALAVILLHEDKLDEAASTIAAIERKNRLGMLDGFIAPLRRDLEARRAAAHNQTKSGSDR